MTPPFFWGGGGRGMVWWGFQTSFLTTLNIVYIACYGKQTEIYKLNDLFLKSEKGYICIYDHFFMLRRKQATIAAKTLS